MPSKANGLGANLKKVGYEYEIPWKGLCHQHAHIKTNKVVELFSK